MIFKCCFRWSFDCTCLSLPPLQTDHYDNVIVLPCLLLEGAVEHYSLHISVHFAMVYIGKKNKQNGFFSPNFIPPKMAFFPYFFVNLLGVLKKPLQYGLS